MSILLPACAVDGAGGCGSFYAIQLSSKQFKGLSTVKAHRLVNQELGDVIKNIHGLQVRLLSSLFQPRMHMLACNGCHPDHDDAYLFYPSSLLILAAPSNS